MRPFITLSGVLGSIHAILNKLFTSLARPILAPLLTAMYMRGKPSCLAISDAFYTGTRDEIYVCIYSCKKPETEYLHLVQMNRSDR